MKTTRPTTRRMVKILEGIFGAKVQKVKFTWRPSQDVPKFLRKFDAVQRRTAKSTLRLG